MLRIEKVVNNLTDAAMLLADLASSDKILGSLESENVSDYDDPRQVMFNKLELHRQDLEKLVDEIMKIRNDALLRD
jgi:uncharacterized protein YfbU (UPF0304 family)